MALVSERGARRKTGVGLSLEDCCCPVCLEIFIEPLTLPCTHTFCKACFLESVDKATLCCPLCRKRVSTWTRLNSRNNTLVNQQLWTQIQTTFPLQCQRRLSGQDAVAEDDPGVSVCFPRVSQPGELRQEYEDQVTKLTEEKRVLEEEERKASEEYIQRLLAEEEEVLLEERRRREEDEQLAKLLSQQLNSSTISQENLCPAIVTPAKKRKEVGAGQIEKFLCPHPSKASSSDCSSASSFMENKENVLLSQAQAQHPLPNLEYYSTQSDTQTDRSEPTSPSGSVEDQLQPETLKIHPTQDGGPSSAKRKSSELQTTEYAKVGVSKRVCHSPPPCSSSSSLELGELALQDISEWEKELLSRQQQEEKDRQLALLLQKELNREEKQQATDRRKGTPEAYLLRQTCKGKEKTSSSNTPSRPSRKTTRNSASSVKTTKTFSPSRGSKQATLTEMFSSLSS